MQLEGYALALVGGVWFIGKVTEDSQHLDPAYEAHVRWMSDERGNFGVLREATPIMGSTKFRRVDISQSANGYLCSEMTGKERESWARAIQDCEGIIQAIRTAEAGIVLAPADSKLIK